MALQLGSEHRVQRCPSGLWEAVDGSANVHIGLFPKKGFCGILWISRWGQSLTPKWFGARVEIKSGTFLDWSPCQSLVVGVVSLVLSSCSLRFSLPPADGGSGCTLLREEGGGWEDSSFGSSSLTSPLQLPVRGPLLLRLLQQPATGVLQAEPGDECDGAECAAGSAPGARRPPFPQTGG